jgi:class 3 adenylate cyclase
VPDGQLGAVSRLDAKGRARLPDSDFAYIDSLGRRRLPINDKAHVRNALSRFDQTEFETEAARDRARLRLLRAAKKYGIVPVGFIDGQLLNVRARAEIEARSSPVDTLPTGIVTFLFADIEGSTALVQNLGDRYAGMLGSVRRLLGAEVRTGGGRVVDIRADELFAVFKEAPAALRAALAIQRKVRARTWPGNVKLAIRIGLHTGRPTLTTTGYVGLAVNMAARVCAAAHGGQILSSRASREAGDDAMSAGAGFRDLGLYELQGLPGREQLYQVEVPDLPSDFPPPRTATSRALA